MRNQRILRDYSPDPFEVMTAVFAKCTIVRLPISACTARDKELIVLTTGDLEILPDQRRVLVSNKSFNLGSRAYDMLEMLADARGELVSKEEIIRSDFRHTQDAWDAIGPPCVRSRSWLSAGNGCSTQTALRSINGVHDVARAISNPCFEIACLWTRLSDRGRCELMPQCIARESCRARRNREDNTCCRSGAAPNVKFFGGDLVR
jgi:hypothetical protein